MTEATSRPIALVPAGGAPDHRVMHRRMWEFGVVCLVLTWVPWTLLGTSGVDISSGAGWIAFGLAASGPSLAALVMWIWRREPRPHGRMRWSAGWVVAAVVLGAAAPVASALVMHGGDPLAVPRHAAQAIDQTGVVMALVFTFLAGPVAEEFGWRGYLQPRLRARHGRLATTVILGAAWGLWHVPLFLLPGTGQHEIGLWSWEALIFVLTVFPLTFLILFVSERMRGGVPAAILMHAAWNFATQVVPSPGIAGSLLTLGIVTAFAVGVAARWRVLDARPAPSR